MNKRIQELQGQTLDKYFSHTWTNMDYVDLSKFAEKFAELIVKECALTLESITVPVSQCYEDFDNGYNKALLTGSTVIKQHFGVEE